MLTRKDKNVRSPQSAGRREPLGEVTHVALHIFKFFRLVFNLVARRLNQKTWAGFRRVPVVIHEMMKAGVSDGAAQSVTVIIRRTFEGDNQIEWTIRHFTQSTGDDAGMT